MYKHIYTKLDGTKVIFTCSTNSNCSVYDITLREVIWQSGYQDTTKYEIKSSLILCWEITSASN